MSVPDSPSAESLTQCASAVLMVRPAAFGFDEETARTNRFQREPDVPPDQVRERAVGEFDQAAASLAASGVDVLVVDDLAEPRTPDAVFPNNWISTHHDGTVVLYPMLAPARRLERRDDIVDRLRDEFRVSRVVDLSPNEERGRFLEGTGSLVFDHTHRTVYAVLSPRTHRGMVEEAGVLLGYQTVVFRARDGAGQDVYHTNVVLSVGERFAVVASESIGDPGERSRVLDCLRATGRQVLEITREPMRGFAANVLELRASDGGAVLAASDRAWTSLTDGHRRTLEGLARIVHAPIPTIESVGGGSLRCMIAELFLTRHS